jgi:hypothetical protein
MKPVNRGLRGRTALAGRFGLVLVLALGSCSSSSSRNSSIGSHLTVNDEDFLGDVGDGRLSLSEAIELASGELPVSRLSPDERAQIDGDPGAAEADQIRFVPGLRVNVRRHEEAIGSILPPLTGDGDSIDGGGVVIDGSAMRGEPQPSPVQIVRISDTVYETTSAAALLVVSASDVSVSGLTVVDLPAGAIVVSGAPDRSVARIRITGNLIQGSGRDGFSGGITLTAGFDAEGQTLSDVEVSGNRILDTSGGVVLFAGAASGSGRVARSNRAENIAIRANRIERPLTGIIAYAAQASLDAEATDNLLEDVVIADNEVAENLDVGILTSTTQPLESGATARNAVRHVVLSGNTIASPADSGRLSTGLFLSGGQVFAGGTSSADRYEDLTAERNVVDGQATGILLLGGDAERCGPGCATRGSSMAGVRLHDDVVRNAANGIVLVGGAGIEAAASVEDNTLADVVVEHETISARDAGIVMDGSLASSLGHDAPCLACGLTFPGYHLPGNETGNRVTDLTLRQNTIEATDAVVITGGTMSATEDSIADASTRRVTLENNQIHASRSTILVLGGVVTVAGSVRESTVETIRCSGNHDAGGAPVGATILDQVATDGADGNSVSGNRVVDATCR